MKALYFIYLSLLSIPLSIILYKLCEYIIVRDFTQWWVTILWILLIPISTLIVLGIKNKGEIE